MLGSKGQQLMRNQFLNRSLLTAQVRYFGIREDYAKSQAKFGKNKGSKAEADFHSEQDERMKNKLNWGIKNRWEQRALDEVIKNVDVRKAYQRDVSRIKRDSFESNVQEFHSVDEIYFFLDQMFTEGFDEHHISIALDVFLRDAAIIEEKDLENETFKKFLRELGTNMVTFTKEENFVKAARFMDWYCIDDKNLWVNLEMYVIKKETMFTPRTYIQILSHFASQHEGSRDFYDFYEFNFYSQVFKDAKTHDIITLLYSFYQVHTGTVSFLHRLADNLIERLDDKVSTFDLLRVSQAYSEISKDFPKLYVQLEQLFMRRLNQMTINEVTTCASAFSISGFGSGYFFQVLEQTIMMKAKDLDKQNLKEVCRGFLYSMRSSKTLLKMLLPRLEPIVHEFSCRELCYLLYAYQDGGFLPKPFAQRIEAEVKKSLVDQENISVENINLIVKSFCASRTASREFHKLLEMTILMRLPDLKQNMKLLHNIGLEFEKSGLCSLDTLKALKKEAFITEAENELFE